MKFRLVKFYRNFYSGKYDFRKSKSGSIGRFVLQSASWAVSKNALSFGALGYFLIKNFDESVLFSRACS